MTGHVRRRGERSWEIKFDLGTDPKTGKRLTRYHSFKGTKREADAELTKLKACADVGTYVDQAKTTVSEFLTRWLADWVELNLSKKTVEGYGDLIRIHVKPRIGAMAMQKVKPAILAELYSDLLKSGRIAKGKKPGLSPRTVAYIHTVLHRAFGHAHQWGMIANNPVAAMDSPRVTREEILILTAEQIRSVLKTLRDTTLYKIAALGLSTGMRRGELLALRWADVDLDAAKLRVEQSLEETTAGLRFKTPKTKHGRRSISLPSSVVTELRGLRKTQAAQRLALGLGKDADGALVFRHPDGTPLLPHSVTTAWRRAAADMGLVGITLHAWRHTHASQLIASGMDVLTISRRLGHGSPSITLNVYGHLFSASDDRAASVFENAFGSVLGE
jgi:integrase